MLRAFKRLLLCLLTLGLPLQGVSAAAMALRMAAPVSAGEQMQTHAQTADAMPCHAMQAMDHTAEHAGTSKATPHKAKACGGCCFSLSLGVSVMPVLPSLSLAEVYRASSPATVVAFLVDGLERPPRPLS